ncbi:MAG: class I SAM-dependent methyltransferase [Chrysiogenales bacterium]
MAPKIVDAGLVEKHFDELADSYDKIKIEKNRYYYQSLIRAVREVVPPGKRILDIGTGTGEILNALAPGQGSGIDLSSAMIQKAREKFPQLRFFTGSYENLDLGNQFDFILLLDVIEHLQAPEKLFNNLKKFCRPETRIVLTMANPAWEPFLHLLEKLKLKMAEGPHRRISQKKLLAYAAQESFTVQSAASLILLPVAIPFISRFFNERLAKLFLLRKMALIKRYVFKCATLI